MEINLLEKYPKTKRKVEDRGASKTEEDRAIARKFGKEFFDGDRKHGYGGFYYHPRFWTEVVKDFISYYNLKPGDIVNIIGHPREYNSEKYILPEIVKKIHQKWMLVRKFELEKSKVPIGEDEAHKQESEETVVEDIEDAASGSGERDKLIQLIRSLDSGQGIEIEQLNKESNLENCEKIIEDMLKEGDLLKSIHAY